MAEKMKLEKLECGFFLCMHKLYFAYPHGNASFCYPVVNGEISRTGSIPYDYDEHVDVLHRDEWVKYGVSIETIEKFTGFKLR